MVVTAEVMAQVFAVRCAKACACAAESTP